MQDIFYYFKLLVNARSHSAYINNDNRELERILNGMKIIICTFKSSVYIVHDTFIRIVIEVLS